MLVSGVIGVPGHHAPKLAIMLALGIDTERLQGMQLMVAQRVQIMNMNKNYATKIFAAVSFNFLL